MKPAYPELMESVAARGARREGRRTPLRHHVPGGRALFHDEAKQRRRRLPGSVAFKLYDTYGLALDEQEEMAREYGLAIDRAGFRHARWSSSASAPAQVGEARRGRGRTGLPGTSRARPHEIPGLRNARTAAPRGRRSFADQQPVTRSARAQQAEIVLDQTPFYAESGGQVGDRGALDA